jgi:hypothetical protein
LTYSRVDAASTHRRMDDDTEFFSIIDYTVDGPQTQRELADAFADIQRRAAEVSSDHSQSGCHSAGASNRKGVRISNSLSPRFLSRGYADSPDYARVCQGLVGWAAGERTDLAGLLTKPGPTPLDWMVYAEGVSS